MTSMGRAQRNGITVAVAPGGALQSIELEPDALRLGGGRLAASILTLVAEASRKAGQAAENAVKAELGEITSDELAVLGLTHDDSSTTGPETTGQHWRGN